MEKKGKVFVVSAPSGAGKSTLCSNLRKEIPSLTYSVSYTTRNPRKGEENGKDYFFIDSSEFKKGIEQGKWAEWALVHGNYYGTSKEYLEKSSSEGFSLLLEIDVQGAMQIKEKIPEAVLIFIKPPSVMELENRLRKRNTDSEEVIVKRLEASHQEMSWASKFDFIIINDIFETAASELMNFVTNQISGSEDKN